MLALKWIEHFETTDAWEEALLLLRDLERGKRFTLLAVMYAPSDSALASVAAGPLEDLVHEHEDEVRDWVLEQSRKSLRFRRCLSHTYLHEGELGAAVKSAIDEQLGFEKVDPSELPAGSQEELALVMAWFHHNDLAWAPSWIDGLIANEPEAAIRVLGAILRLGEEKPEAMEGACLHLFERLLHRQFEGAHEQIVELVRSSDPVRQWVRPMRKPQSIEQSEWGQFLGETGAVESDEPRPD